MNTGHICWAELHTRRPEAATDFYDGLLPLASAVPLADGLVLRPFDIYRHDPFGVVTPGWKLYAAVDNTFATAKRAIACGGDRYGPKRDLEQRVVDTIADPLGNVLGIWEDRGHGGFDSRPFGGCAATPFLYTPEVDAAVRFYQNVLGWTARPARQGGQPVQAMHAGDGRVAAFIAPPPSGITPSAGWVPTWLVDDVQATTASASDLGSVYMYLSDALNRGRVWSVGVDLDAAVFRLTTWAEEVDDDGPLPITGEAEPDHVRPATSAYSHENSIRV